MVDPYRNDVLFALALSERRRLVVALYRPPLPRALPHPVAGMAALLGRASVRLGTWLQGLAEPGRAPECAGAPR